MFTKVLATPATPNACSALPSRNTKRPECHGESDDGGDDGESDDVGDDGESDDGGDDEDVVVMMKMWWWMMCLRWPWPSYIESRRQIEMQ